jgi:hypothetical protein
MMELFKNLLEKCIHSKFMPLKQVLALVVIVLSIPGKVVSVSNGKEVNPPGKFPFVINADPCTAVLVSPNVAIGAAHCCHNKLLVGGHNISEVMVGQEEFEVAETIYATGNYIPYRFLHGQNMYDIVILRLNGHSKHIPISINDFQVPLYISDTPPESEALELLVTGWGSNKRGVVSDTLKQASLDIIPIVECRRIYNKVVETWYGGGRRDLVCASKNVDGQISGPCSGDFGAPLINLKNGKLVGIVTLPFVSAVSACGNEQFPGVFTSVYYYKNWIEEHIEKFGCPWFNTIIYPTSAPTVTKNPSPTPSIVSSKSPTAPPSMSPTEVSTVNPTIHPLITPTKETSKKKSSPKKGSSTMPFIVPAEGSSKKKS